METIIKVDNIYKAFGSHEVLKGVTFEVKKGEILLVIGKSGSGKSVIFKHLTALLRPDRGAIYLENNNIFDFNETELHIARKKFGVAFQLSALFDSLNIYENVSFGLRRMAKEKKMSESEIKKKVADSLALVGLKDIEERMPASLSGGMQKRVSIARAIAYEPEIILYDEPTTGLDPITAAAVDDLIMNLNRELNVTSVVVSHDMKSVFKIADRISMLYDGRMVLTEGKELFKHTENPYVRQFIEGTQKGPIEIA
jgi:phospholipid/cholesterol/gamma-HCH transport system ATP-binding protein